MSTRRPPAWSTIAATGLMAVIIAGFVAFAVASLRGTDDAASREAGLLGLTAQAENTAGIIVGIVILAVSLVTLAQCVGVARRRQGARHAALVTFGTLALLSLAAAVPGVTSSPPRPNAWYGVLVGVADLAVVGLLLLPTTADDIELAEREHDRRAA
ncbi:MAG: hypothetical protein KY460_02925 [Actinobacteria bacterium]|nr:hypothetical protein [Actinomycetota bacterium]